MNLSRNLRYLRRKYDYSQDYIAELLGYKSYTTIQKWESGDSEPSIAKLSRLAELYKVDLDSLMNKDLSVEDSDTIPNIYPIEKKKFPLLGNVACGQPTLANENFEGYIESGSNIHADFCLRAKGDSMVNARILDGDIVFIRKQEMVENGEIAAVLIDDEATLKRFYMSNDLVQLIAENPTIPPMIYKKEDLNGIRILGKAIAFQSDVI